MRLSLTQENLSKALGSVGRIVATRATLPLLSNILLATDGKRLRLSATNLEIGINYWIGSRVIEEGSLTVPARLLADFVSNLPAGNIDLAGNEATLTIKTPHYESKINGMPADEFPVIPQINSEPVLVIQASLFKEILGQVVVAASLDEARPVLAGIYLYYEDDYLYVAATDSYRLAEKKVQLSEDATPFSAIIPVRTMQELMRLLGDATADLEIYLDDAQVMFKLGDIELVSRLIEGKFPPYKQIIPDKALTSFDAETADFIRIVKVAGLFAREGSGSVRLEIREENDVSVVTGESEVGANRNNMECDVSGEDNEVSLNVRYLQDALSVIKTKKVRFLMNDKLSACVLLPIVDDDEESDYLHIVMPLRT